MSVEVMRSVIEAAEGRVPVDRLFTNAQIVDVYGQPLEDQRQDLVAHDVGR